MGTALAFVCVCLILVFDTALAESALSTGADGRPMGLRTMTFNTWLAGRKVANGLDKIAQHIKAVDADIVLLQEMNQHSFEELMPLLGHPWSGLIHNDHLEGKPVILSKHKMVPDSKFHTNWTVGATIFHSSGAPVNVVNAHLNYKHFGPELVNDATETTPLEHILAGAVQRDGHGRLQNAMELNAHPAFQRFLAQTDQGTPLVVAGDFNDPPHQDWTEAARHLHKGWAVEWLVSKYVADKLGMADSFREANPDIFANQGNTWSSVWGEPEMQARIDYIFYRGASLRPVRSFLYSGTAEPLKLLPERERAVSDRELGHRDWPSDHFALVTDFAWSAQKQRTNE